ncbi:MAG: hypothetical protein M1268_01330 [Patescibacteria group bacterium]|nr:hypothetical protein [Patescibacteria group bacterium]
MADESDLDTVPPTDSQENSELKSAATQQRASIIRDILAETGKTIWIHGVRLPTKDDLSLTDFK